MQLCCEAVAPGNAIELELYAQSFGVHWGLAGLSVSALQMIESYV